MQLTLAASLVGSLSALKRFTAGMRRVVMI